MSWEIFIQDLPNVDRAALIPLDFKPRPLGDRDAFVARILEVLPRAERQDSDWLFVRSSDIDLSIQLHLDEDKQLRYIVVHVHGGSQSAAAVAALLRHVDLRAIDTATGELFDGHTLEDPQ